MRAKLLLFPILCLLILAVAIYVLQRPPDLSEFIQKFHGQKTNFKSSPGENATEIANLKTSYDYYDFTAPSQEVKKGLIEALKSGGWKIHPDDATGLTFTRTRQEFGFFDDAPNLLTREPKNTTCRLTLFNGKLSP